MRYCYFSFVFVVVDDVIVVVVDPRNLPLECGQNWISKR